MPRHEQVKFAFMRIRVTHQAAARTDRAEFLESAGDELVRINLVARVPDEAIALKVVGEMQSKAKFYDAEVAGKVGWAKAEDANEFVAHLLRQLQ